ncbi:MAG: DUF4136 domain-containing protein [Bacteroidota bacterium]|nr:DUF4136 domain-containing protein [Bacteroidota bacterium]
MKKIQYYKPILTSLVLILILTACYNKQSDTDLADLDVTATYYDTEFDFSKYNTFAIRDSVGLVEDSLTDEQIAEFYKEGGASEKIREYWKQAFIDLGYQYVEDSTFDFGVNLVVFLVQQSASLFYGNIWYGGYYGWWGWYPPPVYGPPIVLEVNYKIGTIMIEMADGQSVRDYWEWLDGKTPEEIENADPNDIPKILIRWTASINGVVSKNGKHNGEAAERGFREALNQSPYLQK